MTNKGRKTKEITWQDILNNMTPYESERHPRWIEYRKNGEKR